MTIALTHSVSADMNDGELSFIDRTPIDVSRAGEQHQVYRTTLAELGAKVVNLDMNLAFPDSVFIEDVAVVLDELAIISLPGVESRRGELAPVEAVLATYRQTARIEAPATLDGGDVLVVGKRVFVGRSRRTNEAGVESLARILHPHGYQVIPVALKDALHLKTGCTSLDEEIVLVNPDWVDTAPFQAEGFRVLAVPKEESWAANILRIDGQVMVSDGNPATARIVAGLGYHVRFMNIRELAKAEGSLTCLSIIFRQES